MTRNVEQIIISIGRLAADESEQIYTYWRIVDTNAPKDYDGFGTFTVHEYEGTRTVLIREEHYDWQTIRYQSGNNWSRPSDFDGALVAEELWKRLRGESAPDSSST
jgi:hypothetical protein